MVELTGLTEKILRETLRQLQSGSPAMAGVVKEEKKFMVVVTGGKKAIPATIDFIESCVTAQVPITLVLSASATQIMSREQWFTKTGLMHIITNEDQPDVFSLLHDHQQILVPILTINSAAKVSQGITDSLATKLIFHGLLMGKQVTASRESCDLALLPYYQSQNNPGSAGLEELVSRHLLQLEKMGVSLCTTDKFAHLLVESSQDSQGTESKATSLALDSKLITEQDVRNLPNQAVVKLQAKAIITPAAKDMAQSKEIKLTKETKLTK